MFLNWHKSCRALQLQLRGKAYRLDKSTLGTRSTREMNELGVFHPQTPRGTLQIELRWPPGSRSCLMRFPTYGSRCLPRLASLKRRLAPISFSSLPPWDNRLLSISLMANSLLQAGWQSSLRYSIKSGNQADWFASPSCR